ncbi:class I SAM-dependent methyltransferase [Halosegnis marinus]|uniref:Class I SAM-dependent methyltransferase n=1 Tax=Halosegnis marinus TaxID=3034023 RepID=A0ABD5ZMQ7_9EURY|nr:class I SAM-dependent methyltransferase [Halosegnis sp. DT85]
MDRDDVRLAWEGVSDEYARRRDPTGSDAALLDDLLAELPADPDVLDVGCGDGARTLANLPPRSVGLDFAARALELARERVPGARLVRGDMVALPFADDAFDAVTAYHAVFHVPRDDQPAVYREFARVLRPGGRVLATLPSGRFETVRRGWMGGEMFFSAPGREATLSQLERAGFTDYRTLAADDPLGSSTEFVLATLDG